MIGILRIALLTLSIVVIQATWTLAGTTGSIEGKVSDQNGNGLAGAKVTAASQAQHQTATTGTNGFYAILNLSPDTYSVTASKDGYDTATVYGTTVVADQATATDIKLRQTVKTLGHVTTTATSSVVSKTVTGDLYAVNAASIAKAQGASGGAETLYSQNSIVGTLPGVNRYAVGSGPGYGGQGQISMRGGSPDQVGYELDGIPLNRGFDFYNGTSFNTNGLASLEVYTGGAPADAGRAMSGYVNEVIQRGRYPGGADFTAVIGSPLYNHTVQADVYGATPDNHFSYYVSTLASNNYVNFGDRSNLANTSYTVPAGDPGCGGFNYGFDYFGIAHGVPHVTAGGAPLNCAVPVTLNQPASQAAYASTPYNALRDTAANLHWTFVHNGLNDDLQGLYVIGTTDSTPFGMYGTYGADPSQTTEFETGTTVAPNGIIEWPTGAFYKGAVGQPYSRSLLTPLTWPTSGGSVTNCPATGGVNGATGLPFCGGEMPSNFQDNQTTQYAIEKVAYTHSLTQSSFLRVYGYQMYSAWTLNQPINGFVGFSFYQLHDNATGAGLNYQNQINQQNLLKLTGDWSRDLTLRYNYAPQTVSGPTCASGGAAAPCGPGTTLTSVGIPFSTWNNVTPLDWDGILQDTFRPNDKMQFDVGLRWDEFGYQLMPQQITGRDGLAYLSEEVDGICLAGFNYSASDPKVLGPNGNQNCSQLLLPGAAQNPAGLAKVAPGGFAWSNPPSFNSYTALSPRFGATFNVDPRDVVRFSVGRYVQAANSAFQQYTRNPAFGPGAGTTLLNNFMTGLGFGAYHDILPEDSTNYDLSFEHEFNGGYSAKITPYYRDTRNQILSIPFNPASPSFVTGDNFGNAHISGFEFTLQRPVAAASGIGGTMNATFTNSKIRFNVPRGGTTSFINVMNGTSAASCSTPITLANGTVGLPNTGICGYNNAYGTNYAMLDPNGYYAPSFVMAPTSMTPSYDIAWNINFTPEIKEMGFDVLVPFAYVSGNPYGDALQFPDPHCPNTAGGTPVPSNANTGCIAVPAGRSYYGGNGPDPYTGTFDAPGSLKGPSWWTLGLAVSHDIGHNLKASILGTNLVAGVHNQGYPWEQPTQQNNVSYADNSFYSALPLGAFTGILGPGANIGPNPANGYYGNNYYPYSPAGALPYRDWVFSLSMKM
ncbi:MAG: TonB-dependent receptor [Candidatus Eremiobacteraeota bacterium]|nr:TonB-dependent receptor [Candidatus Eremiobacteraeota bacterium]